ncbi:hypothetical protein [Rhizobium leguminosarum]|uniref:hypothetical protein n=1 Tax=Rhizobium leguminosarum TaxID=384 RepID=UPI001C939089|nr:hypothetical protein [Rhizobium leguminosarum]MBY5370469.1 hypothetical protein [Rhizobium leguminosarum]
MLEFSGATIFATRFYAAIASAQSVGASLKQAKVMMKSAFLDDAKLPECVARKGVDVDKLVLVTNALETRSFHRLQVLPVDGATRRTN